MEVTELRRVLEGSYQTARRANGSGLKKAKGGLGDVAVLCESIVASVGNAKSVDDTSPMEKKVNETHSLVMLMYKHMTEQQEALERFRKQQSGWRRDGDKPEAGADKKAKGGGKGAQEER